MTHLVIGLDEYRAVSEAILINTVSEYVQWRAAVASQQNLLQTGVAVNLLSSAVANLPNLKTIDIRDFNSPTRYRDAVGPQASEWRSYGSSSYLRWNHSPYHPAGVIPQSNEFVGQVFRILLAALDRCSPELDSIELITHNKNSSLMDDILAFSPVLGPGLTKTLHGLRKLHLDLIAQDLPRARPPFYKAPFGPLSQADGIFDPLAPYIRSFLAYTKNVTWLRLNYSRFHTTSTKFLLWLSLRPDCDPQPKEIGWNGINPAPVTLPLRRLDLGMIRTQPNVLHKVLAKFPDLESLCLKGARFEMNNGLFDRTVLDDNGTFADGDCVWARFIRGLSVSAPNLKHLTLANLQQTHWSQQNHWGQSQPASVTIFRSGDSYVPDYSHSATIDKDKAKLRQLADVTLTLASLDRLRESEMGLNTEEGSVVDDDSNVEDDEDMEDVEDVDDIDDIEDVEDI